MADRSRSRYSAQLNNTENAADDVQRIIDQLKSRQEMAKANAEGQQEMATDESLKLQYLEHQMLFYDSTMRALGLLTTQLSADRCAERAERKSELYMDATALLHTMEVSLRRVSGMPDCVFMRIYKRTMQTIIEEHPVKATLSVGALVGALISGSSFLMTNCPAYHAAIVGQGLFISSGVGAIIGIVITGLLLGAIHCYQKTYANKDAFHEEEMAHSRELDRLVREFDQNKLEPEAVKNMHQAFALHFMRPALQPSLDDECLICQQAFASSADATTAPNCQAGHFVHRDCQDRWVAMSGNVRCTYCQQ